MYYISDGGVDNNKRTNTPARLDWDIFNHMSHLRVSWHPKNTMNEYADVDAFVELVRHELDLVRRENNY